MRKSLLPTCVALLLLCASILSPANAFYAVSGKKKQFVGEYEPPVTLKTAKDNDQVLISVIDNGNGIPLNLLDKIFQPFFTTKPTG